MSEHDDDFKQPVVTDSPEFIWLQYGDIERDCTHAECYLQGDVTWCEEKQFDSDVKYVRAILFDAVIDERDRLRAALAEAQRDAERYRWLKSRTMVAHFDFDDCGMCIVGFDIPKGTRVVADCDKTIDAAILAAKVKP